MRIGLSCYEDSYLRKVVGRVCRTLLLVLFIIRHDALHRQALGELNISAHPYVFGFLVRTVCWTQGVRKGALPMNIYD